MKIALLAVAALLAMPLATEAQAKRRPSSELTLDSTSQASDAAATSSSSGDTFAGWPGRYSQYIGFEQGTSSIGVIGKDLIVYGRWRGDWAQEYFLGFEKSADTFRKDVTGRTTTTATTEQRDTIANSGIKNPYVLTLGGGMKKRMYQGKWLQVYGGFFGGVTYTTGAKYEVGSTIKTISNTTTPNDYSVSETALGETNVATDLAYFAGTKLGSEFYLKWFPNLALGFSTGVLLSAGGKKTETSTKTTQSYTVVGGVPQTPSSKIVDKTDSVTDKGIEGNTYGLGGTSFQFTGLFTIRYVW